MPGDEHVVEVHVVAARAGQPDRVPRLLDPRGTEGASAATMRGGAPSPGGGSTTMPPTKVAAVHPDSNPQLPVIRMPSVLLRDLDPRLIAPGGAGARVGEELLAEAGLGGRVDQSRADAGMRRDPAGGGVGLRERRDDLEPLGQRAPSPWTSAGTRILKTPARLSRSAKSGARLRRVSNSVARARASAASSGSAAHRSWRDVIVSMRLGPFLGSRAVPGPGAGPPRLIC